MFIYLVNSSITSCHWKIQIHVAVVPKASRTGHDTPQHPQAIDTQSNQLNVRDTTATASSRLLDNINTLFIWMSRADSGLGIGYVLHYLFNHDTDALDRATRHSAHPNATVVASYQCRGNQQYEREPLRYGRRADMRGLLPFAPCMIDTVFFFFLFFTTTTTSSFPSTLV